MKRKKKLDPLAGKRDPVSQLYRAIRRYVEHHDGNIIVVGGIQVQEWPEDSFKGKYTIAVQCLGKRPSFKAAGDTNG